MKQSKKMLFSVIILVLAVFHNSYAQCSGKTVYVQIPTEGSWSKTSVYIYWEGQIRPAVSATAEGTQFVKFTFPTNAPNDGSGKTFSLSMKSTQIDEGNRWIASGSRYNVTGNRPTDAQGIPCSSFGTGSTLYIYPNPTSPTTTILRTDPPNARYFYFLPPNDKDWISSAPYLWYGGNTSTKMEIDPDRCGWYRIVYFSTPPSDNEALIIQSPKDATNPNSTNKIGVNGMGEDPSEWINGIPTPIKLKSKFDEVLNCNGCGGDLFFVAEGYKMGWHKTDPMIDEMNRCSYSFAARIYDTDMQVNKSFTSSNDDIGCGSDQYSLWTSGIIKGMVKPTLNPDTRKIECANCARGGTVASSQGYFLTEQDFKNAFDPNSNTNVVVFYDMPFARSSDGLWEFDSDKMVNNQGRLVGGFFPEILQNPAQSGADYSSCPSCGTKSPAESFVNLTSSINPWCFERGLRTISRTGTGQSLNDCGGAYGPGDFSHADNPPDTWGATPTGYANWDADWRASQINMWNGLGGGGIGKNATANQLFCFESHAEFTYEPGQEFFFRGDDDIWVYMNNQLVIDLGGTHLAAPGYVNLRDQASKLGLTEGEKYPIDIFFCDRRTGMSNVRIKTNMYFSQETGLSLATKDPSVKGDVCLKRSGGDKLSCGTEINSGLEYYLRNRAGTFGDNLASIGLPGSNGERLNRNNENCVEGNVDSEGHAYLLCYGGIKIYNRIGKVQVLVNEITGLAGTWQVWVTHNEEPHPTLKVEEFTKNVKVQVVWGEVRTENGELIDNLNPTNSASVMAGQTVKIGFAAAEPTGNNRFSVLMDPQGGSPGQSFSIAPSSLTASGVNRSELTLCYDEACNEPVYGGTSFTIPYLGQPNQGLLVLYAKGNFEAANDAEYVIKVASSSAEFRLKVYQPRMRFVDGSNRILSEGERRFSDPSKDGAETDRWVWLGEEMQRTVAAFDPSSDPDNENGWKLCGKLCDGITLRYTANAEINKSTYDNELVDINGLTMENGVAKLSMAGITPVEKVRGSDDYDWASVKICGPSRLESTCHEWTKLQFRATPVPFPISAEIYDRKGGGRGDSLVIVYSSRFGMEAGVHDYPNYIQVIWDENITDTIGYGSQFRREPYGYAFNGSPDANINFWNNYLRRGSSADSIIITRDDYEDSFSGYRIKTAGNGVVVSWMTFDNPDRPGALITIGSAITINEKIPPIITSAIYIGGQDCGTRDNPCTDNIIVNLSEPVKLAENASENEIKTAFAYILKSMGMSGEFKVFDSQNDLPAIVRWQRSAGTRPAASGDSSVTLTFRAFKGQNDTAFTPVAGDSIRFLAGRKSYSDFDNVARASESPLIDLNGNHPHPLEWGKQIIGPSRRFIPIMVKVTPMLLVQDPLYYNLKGEPLGKQKPEKAGAYIVRQNGVNKMVVVK